MRHEPILREGLTFDDDDRPTPDDYDETLSISSPLDNERKQFSSPYPPTVYIAYRTTSMKSEDEKRKKSSNPKVKRRKTNDSDSQRDQEDGSSGSVSPTDNTNNLSTGACENVSQRYEKVGRVGQGTYGVVYKARDKIKGGYVALKRCLPHHESSDGFPLTTLREIHALRVCSQHEHIVSLLQVSVSSSNGVFLVFEYCTHDLAQLIDAYYPKHRKSPFQQSHVKTLLQQLLSALEFVHSHYLLHRDVKLSNLLYTSDGQLKLADFGLSRHSGGRLTPNVVSLWYRAPELILMKDNGGYTSTIDLWAVGCVFGELLQGFPLLDGRDELEQVTKMLSILGNPPPGLFPSVAKVDRTKERVLLDRFCYLSPQGLTLLTRLLDYNPDSRWTAAQALASPYFEQDPRPSTRMPIFPSRHDGYSKSK